MEDNDQEIFDAYTTTLTDVSLDKTTTKLTLEVAVKVLVAVENESDFLESFDDEIKPELDKVITNILTPVADSFNNAENDTKIAAYPIGISYDLTNITDEDAFKLATERNSCQD